jgi:hypothetical protein
LIILKALENINVNLDLLKETKIGIIVNNCRKKYQNDKSVSDKCKNLIVKWKKIAEPDNTKTGTSSEVGAISKTIIKSEEKVIEKKNSETPPISLTSSSSNPSSSVDKTNGDNQQDTSLLDEEYERYYEALSKHRRQVHLLFFQQNKITLITIFRFVECRYICRYLIKVFPSKSSY